MSMFFVLEILQHSNIKDPDDAELCLSTFVPITDSERDIEIPTLEIEDPDESADESVIQVIKPRKTISKRVKWSEEEITEIRKYFGDYLKLKKKPGKKECLARLAKSKEDKGVLHRRFYHTLITL